MINKKDIVDYTCVLYLDTGHPPKICKGGSVRKEIMGDGGGGVSKKI